MKLKNNEGGMVSTGHILVNHWSFQYKDWIASSWAAGQRGPMGTPKQPRLLPTVDFSPDWQQGPIAEDNTWRNILNTKNVKMLPTESLYPNILPS